MDRSYAVSVEDMEEYLQRFLETNFVNFVQFSFTEYDEETGLGTLTTIEKKRIVDEI